MSDGEQGADVSAETPDARQERLYYDLLRNPTEGVRRIENALSSGFIEKEWLMDRLGPVLETADDFDQGKERKKHAETVRIAKEANETAFKSFFSGYEGDASGLVEYLEWFCRDHGLVIYPLREQTLEPRENINATLMLRLSGKEYAFVVDSNSLWIYQSKWGKWQPIHIDFLHQ